MRSRCAAGGFTLMEVVISLTLVSLIMLGLVGALRTFAESSARIEARSELGDELRIVPEFLDRIIGSAVSRARTGVERDENRSWFMGSAQELQWLGIMPARHGVGGMTHFRLVLQEGIFGRMLSLQYVPFTDDQTQPDWAQAEIEVVTEGVLDLTFSYRAPEGGEWQTQWDGQLGLPGWVSLTLNSAQGAWPWMVFRIRQTSLRAKGESR